MTKVLLENKADVSPRAGLFGNALQTAAYKGNLEIAKLLLENKADVMQREGYLFLLENKADVNAQGGEHGSALETAVYKGNLEIAKLLVENEADVNAQEKFGSALYTAASHGYLDIVKFLVEEKHVDDIAAQQGLYAAAGHGQLHIVKYLIEHTAIVMTQKDFATALRVAEREEQEDIIKFLRSIQPNPQTNDGLRDNGTGLIRSNSRQEDQNPGWTC
ncbi:putative serine/threonine-protein kinase ripk4 [Lentinula aff. lateritia]|uniref:Serine/threonine-protein kinase ripk4 n=1 Tax=Lentinula aff. lateritia TaxID=2804960 RepID=A0ACC1TID3_9AGAR|nr:putative serine/threonine-protein kinase ripk4 [Lentinula aff. lateritia]